MKAYFALRYPYSVSEISLFISATSLSLHYLFPTCSLTSTPFSQLLWASTKPACTLTFPATVPVRAPAISCHEGSNSSFHVILLNPSSQQLQVTLLSWDSFHFPGHRNTTLDTDSLHLHPLSSSVSAFNERYFPKRGMSLEKNPCFALFKFFGFVNC